MNKAKVTHHAWDKPLPMPEGETKKLIGTIYGKSSGIKAVKMPNGDIFNGLLGEFEATNSKTGEITQSGVCYLPSGFHDLIENQVRGLKDGEQIEFVYKVYSVPATSAAGFAYAFEPMMPPAETDNLAHLRKMLEGPSQAEQRAIAAPNGSHASGRKGRKGHENEGEIPQENAA